MVKIRLKKFGTKKRPCYRVVIQDSRKPRDGACIEELISQSQKKMLRFQLIWIELSTGLVLVHSLLTLLRN